MKRYFEMTAERAREIHTDTLIDDDKYRPLPDDCDESPFLERLFTENDLFIDHCSDALFGDDKIACQFQTTLRLIKSYSDSMGSPDRCHGIKSGIDRESVFRDLGERIYMQFERYAESISDEE